MCTKFVVTLFTKSGAEFKATLNDWESVTLFMSKYDWVRLAICKRNDI